MKKIVNSFILIFVLWVGLSLTNPTIDDYKEHVRTKMQGSSENVFTQVGSYVLSEAASTFVIRRDYKILSIYIIQDPFGGEYKTLGVLKLLIDI